MMRPIAGIGSIAIGVVFASLTLISEPMDTLTGRYPPALTAVAGIAFGLYLIATSVWRR